MALPTPVELWQSVRRQVLPRWVLVALDSQGLAVQEWKPGRRVAMPLWELSWPAGLCRQGRPTNPEALGAFLGDFLIEQGIVAAHALAALPPACSHWRVLEGLADNPHPWRQQLAAQERLLRLPLPLSQLQLDRRPWPNAEAKQLLVAADRLAVDGWIDVFAQAGLTLDRLEPVQLCWMDGLLTLLREQAADEATVLLHSGTDGGVWMVVWRGLEPVVQHRFEVGAGDWMVELQGHLQALQVHLSLQSVRLVWDGPSDAVLTQRPLGLPALTPAPVAEFGRLALAGLALAQMPERNRRG